MRYSPAGALAVAAVASLAAGCAMNEMARGGVGNMTSRMVQGAIGGAVIGGAGGAVVGTRMDTQARDLAEGLPGATVQRVGEGIAVTFPERLLFAFHHDELTPAARHRLRRFAASLNRYPDTRILIVDHTDSHGSAGRTMSLSGRRALSTARFFAAEGVGRARMCTAGSGDGEPRAPRVEIAIYAAATTANPRDN